MNTVPSINQINEAAERIARYAHHTPVMSSVSLNHMFDMDLYFKCENFQKVGAFKFRGACNAVFSLERDQLARGVATHSSGNHAQALALAAATRHTKAYIVMPSNAPEVKRNAVIGYGAEVIDCDPTLEARESTLAQVVEKTGAHFVHPYNDYRIIAGQATAAKELFGSVNKLDYVITPVGGGGLLSGTCLSAHYYSPSTKVLAGEPEGADDAWQSLQKGEIVPSINPTTIADGLLTSLGDKTFSIIKKHVKEIIRVTDQEIIDAMYLVWERMKLVIEPSAAVPLAAIIRNQEMYKNARVGIILSGGNVDLKRFHF